jgi:phytoene dehydrogenase-like protein
VGAATLPQNGMSAVSEQLASKARAAGVEIRTDSPVARCHVQTRGKSGFLVDLAPHAKDQIRADSVIIATDGHVAQKLMSRVDGFESLKTAHDSSSCLLNWDVPSLLSLNFLLRQFFLCSSIV